MLEDKLLNFRTQQQKEEEKKKKKLDGKSFVDIFKSTSLYQLVFGSSNSDKNAEIPLETKKHYILKSKNDLKKEKLEQIQNRLKSITTSIPTSKTASEENEAGDDDDNDVTNDEEIEEIKKDKTINYLNIFLKFLLWLILYIIFIKLEFALVYIIVSIIVFVYVNTSTSRKKKANSLSAYSVFNPNLERIDGTLTSEQLEKSLIKMF